MKLRTLMEMEAGTYKALVNYSVPHQASPYLTQTRRDKLPIKALRACVFFYQGKSKAPPIRTDKYMARKPGGRVGTPAPRYDPPSSTSKEVSTPSSKKRARSSTPVEKTWGEAKLTARKCS